MIPTDAQQFLNDLDKKLWNAADRLRASLDAAVYKHAVLGLIFLKYVSDAFRMRQDEVTRLLRDPESDYFLDPADYGGPDSEAYAEALRLELEERDYYLEKNVFWVPALARWKTLQDNAKLPPGTKIEVANGKKEEYEIKSLGRFIDDALEAVERENPRLKGFIEKNRYARLEIPQENLGGLIDLIATIPFEHADLHAKDILGHVYEYFLGQFALAEGKKGGQYFTPKSIVSLIVEMLEPYQGRVYDPAMGSGGFFVQSERFIKEHGGKLGNLSVYGQESNPTTWRLAAMNMAIRGIDFNFGKEPANSFTNDQHPDLRADYVMANPPFNIKEWWDGKLEGDPRWKYGTPPPGNANFAWVQHMLHHLAPNGSMALLLANGSMSSNSGGEGDIRRALLEADLVEAMVALPGQLFTNTQIPACIWFLSKNKQACGTPSSSPSGRGRERVNGFRDRRGEILFIDARQLGYMKDRVLRDFTPEDTEKIAGTFRKWRHSSPSPSGRSGDEGDLFYQDIPGFCKSCTLEEIIKHDHVLTPGRYVGATDEEDDGVPFETKMKELSQTLYAQMADGRKLDAVIRKNLEGLGYGE
ncbi:MAG: type I restriction-modification system subunit M [Verrucomicrobia bacterium]|nr:type I restriction-modification system subunit M [Verrucomicrobiota bacterium]MCH8511869.1 type I restriction-modification system subunit M [Kiritimatiellia bacterium]